MLQASTATWLAAFVSRSKLGSRCNEVSGLRRVDEILQDRDSLHRVGPAVHDGFVRCLAADPLQKRRVLCLRMQEGEFEPGEGILGDGPVQSGDADVQMSSHVASPTGAR